MCDKMTTEETVNLNTLFKAAVQAIAAVDEPWIALSVLADADLSRASESFRRSRENKDEPLRVAAERLSALESASHVAGVISSNDCLEDFSTSSIKFLLIPFLFSRLYSAVQGAQPERLQSLEKARNSLIEFFGSVDNLGLLSKEDHERYLDDTVEVVRTPTQKREEKIVRFKAEKEAERKLKVLLQRKITHGGSTADDDEEQLRDCSLTIVQSAIHKAMDEMPSIDQEIEILRFATRERAKGRDPREKADAERRKAPPSLIPGMPPTFKIVSKKEEIRQGVFRPSHSLPTYTVEEWGDIEVANAVKKENERKEAEIVKARQKADEDSDGDEAADRETMEKRRWDNWRDLNNKGSGNTTR